MLKHRLPMIGTVDPTFASTPQTWYFNESTNEPWYNPTGLSTDWEAVEAITGPEKEDKYQIPFFPLDQAGDQTRTAQTNFDGGAYLLHNRMIANRLCIRFTSVSGSPTFAAGLYQRAGGRAGSSWTRKASITAYAVTNGTKVIPFTEAEFDEGPLILLCGQDSALGGFAFYGYYPNEKFLYNEYLPTMAYPVMFRTTIACSGGPPASFDPRPTPTGSSTPDNVNPTAACIALAEV